jgi:transcriptional regulator with XRE-family HTH domain
MQAVRESKRTSQVSGKPLLPFGAWLLCQLERKGMTQAEFAQQSGISDGSIGCWLYTLRPNPASCYRIAGALGLPAWMALEAAGHPCDGLLGVPSDDVRRDIMRRLERLTTEQALYVLNLVRELSGK